MGHWLERAERARVHAELLTDAGAKRAMLEVAENYQKLAGFAAEREPSVRPT
jgi:hypothetical protein